MSVAVLCVEDAPDDAELLLRELRRGGLEVEWRRVETEPALREALAERRWDVALLDYVLPRFSALHALPVIHELDPDLPAIVVSGTIGEDVAVGAMRAGAADYILKDDLRRLVPAVEREVRDGLMKRERRAAVAERDLSEPRYRALYDQSPAGVFLYDDALRITECNERLAAISGVPRETLRGMDLGALRSPEMVQALRRALAGDNGAFEGPYAPAGTGATLFLALTAAPLKDSEGAVVAGFAVVQDLTERQEFLGTIRRLAYEDSVTGLPNSALFHDRLRQAVTLAKRERRGWRWPSSTSTASSKSTTRSAVPAATVCCAAWGAASAKPSTTATLSRGSPPTSSPCCCRRPASPATSPPWPSASSARCAAGTASPGMTCT